MNRSRRYLSGVRLGEGFKRWDHGGTGMEEASDDDTEKKSAPRIPDQLTRAESTATVSEDHKGINKVEMIS